MSNKPDPFEQLPSPVSWPKLKQLNVPHHRALAEFLHGEMDSATRTTAVTTLVMSLWQLTGRRMSHRLPSLVLVNAEGSDPDPSDRLASLLLAVHGGSAPGIYQEGLFMGGKPEQAPRAMAKAVKEMQEMGAVTVANASIRSDLEQRYFDAQRTGFGRGAIRCYADAWHDVFYLITDRKGELILRLDSQADRETFHQDVLEKSDKLRAPIGYGPGLQLAQKATAVSGAIPVGMWDAGFAGAVVELGLPMFFLPSIAMTEPDYGNLPFLEMLSSILPKAFDRPVDEPANLIPEPWFEQYGKELRKRLHHLPADYEYSIQKLAREITPVCQRIAGWCSEGASPLEAEALWLELCMHTLRGLVLSIAGLAWHGLGFDTGCSRSKTLKVLERLRDNESMTMSELLRGKACLKKNERDFLIDRFTEENLVRVDGKTVAATSYLEFVTALYARPELPLPVDLMATVAK